MPKHKYPHKITEKAESDLNETYDYISQDLAAPQAAENTISKIEAGIGHIRDFPLSCPLVNDDYLAAKGYRLLVISNYNVFYIFENNTVFVMRVLYAKRNYINILKQ
jgi:plasmid stabilization system protein ParE